MEIKEAGNLLGSPGFPRRAHLCAFEREEPHLGMAAQQEAERNQTRALGQVGLSGSFNPGKFPVDPSLYLKQAMRSCVAVARKTASNEETCWSALRRHPPGSFP